MATAAARATVLVMKPNKNPRLSPESPSVRPSPPTQEQIAALAHAIWIDRGCPEGSDVDNWLEAERQLRGEVRRPAAADDLPASEDALDPTRAVAGRVERALDRVVSPPSPRSPTSL
jgi:hypothetical protein